MWISEKVIKPELLICALSNTKYEILYTNHMIIFGFDPGYERCGVAAIKRDGGENLVFSDCLRTSSKDDFEKRLFKLGQEIEELFSSHRPQLVGVESVFFNTNQKTATNVAQVRGLIAYLAQKYGAQVYAHTPAEIKLAITGYGKSQKSQVQHMVKQLVRFEKKQALDDEYDAIAVALTCSAHHGNQVE